MYAPDPKPLLFMLGFLAVFALLGVFQFWQIVMWVLGHLHWGT